MANLSHSESRRLYSWWWDSHIPKNSKWLQENLKDMDAKVKAMIKLIEEDADSFARRAEMYYKKRPELMKLVEEFYRAYRALAERYDHATVELRQAHRTMAQAFPDQVPYVLADDSSSEPHTPETRFLDPDDLSKDGAFSDGSDSGTRKRGLRQLTEMFGNVSEGEIESLKKMLAEIQAEKEAVLQQHQQSLQKLSSMERELKEAGGLGERASRAEIEVKILRETLLKLEAERDAGFLQYKLCLEKISGLEILISRMENDVKGLNERANKAEKESETLKQELCTLEAEKEASLARYNQCLEMISVLENKVSEVEAASRILSEETERAELEIQRLNGEISLLNEEKEAVEIRYEQCLERIAELENELSLVQENVGRLNSEVLMGNEKLKSAEEQCTVLERSNESLKIEAKNLEEEIAAKDLQLLERENNLMRLQDLLRFEQLQFQQLEADLQALQKLHSQSQEEQRALALELENRVQMLKDLEISNNGLQEDLKRAKDENQSLSELNSSSVDSMANLQAEISSLKEMKHKLEEELSAQVALSFALQQEICRLKEEMEMLNRRYQALIEQVKSTGLDSESLGSAFRDLRDENSKLKEVCKKITDEKDNLNSQLSDTSKSNAVLERSVSELNSKLEDSREKVKELQETCQFLQGEKSGLAAEKAVLLTQLQTMSENMQKLLEKDVVLEKSLSNANAELEGLRVKSRSLEEYCEMLKTDNSSLQNERSSLVIQLADVEKRLGNLEMRFTRLEEKYGDLERQKESTRCEVKELQSHLGIEKQERVWYIQSSETRMADLEKQVVALKEESRLSKKEYEEELDKAANAQVEIFILQKFMQDLEEKNLSLLFECKKQVEASKLSNKVISELETENLEQQVEIEFLLDEIEKLRLGVHRVLKAVHFNLADENEDLISEEQIPLHILDKIEDLKGSIVQSEDEKHQLAVENLVFLTLLGEMRSEGAELDSQKKILDREFEMLKSHCAVLQNDKDDLLETNLLLKSEIGKREQQKKTLKAEIEARDSCFDILQDSHLKAIGENKLLLEKFTDLKEEMSALEEENSGILEEALSLGNLSLVLESVGRKKTEELEVLSCDLSYVSGINDELKNKIEMLEAKLEEKEAENLQVKETIEKLLLECEESKLEKLIIEKQMLELAEDLMGQKREIGCLEEEKENLVFEVSALSKELEERRTREENLSLELQERANESELWDAEASSFYFDLQISSIHEVLLENKVHELTVLCSSLEDEKAAKDLKIEQMKETSVFLETEVGELKAQLSAYGPVIAALRHSVESLENNANSRNSSGKRAQMEKRLGLRSDDNVESLENNANSRSSCGKRAQMEKRLGLGSDDNVGDGISELLKIQDQIKAVQKAVIKDKNSKEKDKSSAGQLRLRDLANREKEEEEREDYCKITEAKSGIRMKDIPLDQVSDFSLYRKQSSEGESQMLELWESAEQDHRLDRVASIARKRAVTRSAKGGSSRHEPSLEFQVDRELGIDKLEVSTSSFRSQERTRGKILERLASDAQKLVVLQTTLADLKKQMAMKKRGKKTNTVEFEKVKRQLQQAEDAILQLVFANDQHKRHLEESEFSPEHSGSISDAIDNVSRRKLMEEAKKESEKIGRLQFELQSVQYILLKLEDEKKSKEKRRFSGIVLRDFIYRKSNRRRKKGCFCIRPSTRED